MTLFTLLLAALQTLVQRSTGRDDITIGSPVAGRTSVEAEKLIGIFINTLVLRTSFSRAATFLDVLTSVRQTVHEAIAHQELPFEKVVEALQPERDMSRTPLFQMLFQLRNVARPDFAFQGLTAERLDCETGIARFDLNLDIRDDNGGLLCRMEYNSALFESSTVERMLEHFHILLESVIANPGQSIGALPLLSDTERALLFAWGQGRSDSRPPQTLHAIFEAQAKRTPEAAAVLWQDQPITYRELDHRANQLAATLRQAGVGPEIPVGISSPRGPEAITAVLAILKAGGAFVPLDPAYPQERFDFMLAEASVHSLITGTGLARHSPASPALKEHPADPLAYIVFTSGSTGRPKAKFWCS